MAGLQGTIENVAKQLRGMTLSQRLAVLLAALLVTSSLAWMVGWAARPEMVPLLPQIHTPAELAALSEGLELINEPYRIAGSQILVQAGSDRSQVLARLQQADKMPADTSSGFQQLVQDANPWLSQQENNRRWTLAMQTELQNVLGNFAGVRSARVFLNLNAQRPAFVRMAPQNTASVTLTTQSGEPVTRSLAMAAARMVSGAVRGLAVQNVQVVDSSSGTTAIDWGSETDGAASTLVRQQREQEREIAGKILAQLGYIPDVKVSVQVVLDHTASETSSEDFTEGPLLTKRKLDSQRRSARQGGQPGVQPNTGEAVGATSDGESDSEKETDETYQPSRTRKNESTPAGRLRQAYAAVSISHKYLEGVFMRNNADATEGPTEAQLEDVFTRQKQKIVDRVAMLVYPPEVEQISVDWHYDGVAVGAASGDSSALDQTMAVAGRYGPLAALGMLSMFSLFLLMRMAKKTDGGEAFGVEIGLPQEAIAAAQRARDDVTAGDDRPPPAPNIPVGAAAEGFLEGQEVDEATLQVARMVEQMGEIVDEDEEAVANLVERWVEQTN